VRISSSDRSSCRRNGCSRSRSHSRSRSRSHSRSHSRSRSRIDGTTQTSSSSSSSSSLSSSSLSLSSSLSITAYELYGFNFQNPTVDKVTSNSASFLLTPPGERKGWEDLLKRIQKKGCRKRPRLRPEGQLAPTATRGTAWPDGETARRSSLSERCRGTPLSSRELHQGPSTFRSSDEPSKTLSPSREIYLLMYSSTFKNDIILEALNSHLRDQMYQGLQTRKGKSLSLNKQKGAIKKLECGGIELHRGFSVAKGAMH
ncbi:serine/arginine-rich splicing factor 6-like, partial [Penaeus japonicus]|uniref:serine/arginine-rich splicing factor 6-like n=1 Tax=Penaeus japonicus TaxID=27405 RepID=UPI001C715387